MRRLFLFLLLLLGFSVVNAQQKKKVAPEHCATMPYLEKQFSQSPALKERFIRQREELNEKLRREKNNRLREMRVNTVITIPVVFHVVLPNPNLVTTAQLLHQLDSLNKDFSGTNGSAANIPSWFSPLKGSTDFQFCLAQKDPRGEETNGIHRVTTTVQEFGVNNGVKLTSQGGTDAWNTEKYLNIWVTALSDGIIGFGTFPESTDPEFQGVVIDYRSLPNGSYAEYNRGKTLTHEMGHYFGIYHIWGDDDGECTGTDYIDDTPNQADATEGCKTGKVTDSCSGPGNGIMYQNFMDYSYDRCLMMFTSDQVSRMHQVFNQYRSSLSLSDACSPPVIYDVDAWLTSLISPEQRICSETFAPVVVLKNRGNQTLTSVKINFQIDGQAPVVYTWTGSLARTAETVVTMNNITATAGKHDFLIYTSNPNNTDDQNKVNDTLGGSFQYYPPVTEISESFETYEALPPGWDVVNPDGLITWQRKSGYGKTGTASMFINNFDYELFPSTDDLRLPEFSLPPMDSAFLSFWVAAAAFSPLNTQNNNWDTLEVLISTDCGKTYTSVYKKWGESLVTRTTPTTIAYVPRSNEWRKDSVSLQNYINKGNILVAFRNTTGYENNVYLDDINLRKVNINPNLKAKGFLVTPNPVRDRVTIQFYPVPATLKAIQLFNSTGQKMAEINVGANPGVYYQFQTAGMVRGIYFVRAVFTDKVEVRKILKE
ncbi:M43 family zinc metalloprotease [Pollutibacter soli]|uniref:M43 family zinc metalloprotease n=1 Tax=Pollutibacter soli TaxID=3034157 RepID=UPI003013555F